MDSKLLFYDIMKYPVPNNQELFYFDKKTNFSENFKNDNFSRLNKDPLMEEYVSQINKHSKFFKSLPFVSTIYLCNSITFNKLNNNSDIDLLIIAKKKSIWRARLFSLIYFRIK